MGKIRPTEKVGRKFSGNRHSSTLFGKLKASYSWFIGLDKSIKLASALFFVLVLIGSITILLSREPKQNQSQDTYSSSAINDASEASNLTAKITITEGSVQYKPTEGDWQPATLETSISEDGSIRTIGAASRAEITFENGSVMRIDANSEVTFETMTLDRVVSKQVDGYSYNRVSESAQSSYVVTSKNAQYEALGTAFRVAATGDGEFVEVFHNSVIETKVNKTAKQGERLIVKSVNNPTDENNIQKLSIADINDDKFIAWNIELDKKSDDFKSKLGFLSDLEAPEITISSHTDGATVLLEPGATEGSVEISGTTEKGATLTVSPASKDDPQGKLTVSVDDTGAFKTPVITTGTGSIAFNFVSKDRAGNTTEKTIRITFQPKSGTTTTTTSTSTTLSLSTSDTAITASWTYGDNKQPKDGVMVVYSDSPNPTYEDNLESLEVKNGKSKTIDISSAGLEADTPYFFRVCTYNKDTDSCSNYSNQESVTLP